MVILLFFAFVSGFLTILAPCIWPLLPIILSSATTGGKRKPLGITLGIMLSFGVFTLTISYIVKLIPFDPNLLRLFAVIVISFLGITLLIPILSQKLEGYVSRLSGSFGSKLANKNGFHGGFITGLALGIVWAPCAGPILATIATLAATQQVNSAVVLVTLFYVLGVGIPLFVFAEVGSRLFTKSRFVSKYTGRIQQIFGIIMILTAFAILTNFDKVLQAKLLDVFPSYSSFLTKFESTDTVKQQLDALKNKKDDMTRIIPESGLSNYGPATEFTGITKWLNVEKPLTMTELRGKVVLVDFWTYTCINCIRTLPYVTRWYDKYKDQGFVVIGVHTPEFEFEKNTTNVQNAIAQYNIHYPVAQDNDYKTWNAYNNQYWPAEYLIDAKGIIRRKHFGEGEYDQTEMAIKALLKEAGRNVDQSVVPLADQTPKQQISPETYLGAKRMQYYYPDGNTGTGSKTFQLAENPSENTFSYGGSWNIMDEYATSGKNAAITYNFTASKVFLVITPATKNDQIKVLLDGKTVEDTVSGSDVHNGTVAVDSSRLYNLIDLKGKIENHILKLEFQTPGIQVFAFTFG